jgi:hypothetical protein
METVLPSPPPSSAAAPEMSLPGRLLNVYATPGDVFDVVKEAELCVWNWLVPVLLSSIVGILYVLVVFAQPNVQQQLKEKQDQQLQKLVDSGKMTAADMEAQRTRMDQMGVVIVKVVGGSAAVLTSFAFPFILAVVLKVVARCFLGGTAEYMKLVEVAGLASMVSVLGIIVQMLLVVVMENVYVTPGPALFIGNFDVQNKVHLLLASVNLMTFWYLSVLGIGLARLAGGTFPRAAGPLFALWAGLRLSLVFLGWGSSGL